MYLDCVITGILLMVFGGTALIKTSKNNRIDTQNVRKNRLKRGRRHRNLRKKYFWG